MTSLANRTTAFEDGIIVLDPVTGQLVTVAPMAEELLTLLKEFIENGVTGRQALLEALRAELALADPLIATRTSAQMAKESLLSWIDLARHLYA